MSKLGATDDDKGNVPRMVTLKAELENTKDVEGLEENLCAKLSCSVPSNFPKYKETAENLALAQLNLESDFKKYGFFEDDDRAAVNLKKFRKINIPAFTREAVDLDPLSPIGHAFMVFFGWKALSSHYILVQHIYKDDFSDMHNIYIFGTSLIDCVEGKPFEKANYDDVGVSHISSYFNKLHILFDKICEGLRSVSLKFMIDDNKYGFINAMRDWFHCHLWWMHHDPKHDFFVTKRSKLSFKRIVYGVKITGEYIAALKGIFIEREIRLDPICINAVEAGEQYVTLINEIIEYAEHVHDERYDRNVYLQCEDKTLIPQFFEYGTNACDDEHKDYFSHSVELRNKYSENKILLRYMDIWDNIVVGQLPWYTINPRYGNNKYWVDDVALFEKEGPENYQQYINTFMEMCGPIEEKDEADNKVEINGTDNKVEINGTDNNVEINETDNKV